MRNKRSHWCGGCDKDGAVEVRWDCYIDSWMIVYPGGSQVQADGNLCPFCKDKLER